MAFSWLTNENKNMKQYILLIIKNCLQRIGFFVDFPKHLDAYLNPMVLLDLEIRYNSL